MPGVVHDDEDGDVEMVEGDDQGTVIDDIRIPGPAKANLTFDPDGPRLIITHIECENFKSYAGKHVMGPFHKNGSGKSNVIDSLLFVFGTAAKKIRSTKISSLIHNSDKYPNLTFCRVVVHFRKIIDQGAHKYSSTDVHVAIARTAYQNNSSTYEINGKKSTFKSVNQLLKQQGIDLFHSRFLILQGEVEQISLMSPKAEGENGRGMLEYLEDVIGTDRYVEPLKKIEEKLDEWDKERTSKVVAVKFVEDQLDKLDEPWNKAIRYLKNTNGHAVIEHKLQQYKIMEINQKLDEELLVKDKIDEECKEIQEKFKKAEEDINKKKEDLNQCKKLSEETEKKWDKVSQEFMEIEGEDAKLRTAVVNLRGRLAKLKKQQESEEQNVEKFKKLPGVNAAKINEISNHIEKLDKEKNYADEAYNTALSTLKGQTDELQVVKEKYEKERLALQKSLNQAKKGMDMAKSKLDIFEDSNVRAKQNLAEMEKTYKESSDKWKHLTGENGKLGKQIREANVQLDKAKVEHERIKGPLHTVEREFLIAQHQFNEIQRTYENSNRSNRLLNELSKQRDSGKIPGFIGRLGDLATIDDKYDVAISTACGLLDYYLVDNEETGKLCVEFARERRLGVANCILLNKQENLRAKCQQKMSVPAGSHRLFDLLRVRDPSHLTAFYFALRDTLVVNSIDDGDRISKAGFGPYRRCRVVSLDGTLFETTGAFSGGGAAQKGRMKSTLPVSAQEVEQAKTQYEVKAKERDQLVKKNAELMKTIEECGRNLPGWTKKLKMNTMEIESLEDMSDKLKKSLDEQKKRVKDTTCDPAELKHLKEEFEKASAVYKEERKRTDEIDRKVKDVNQDIKKVNDKMMQGAQDKRNHANKKLQNAKTMLAELEAATAAAERNCKKAQNKVEKIKEEIIKGNEEHEKNQKTMKENETKGIEIMKKKQETENEIIELKHNAKKMERAVDKCREQHNELRQVKVDVDNKVKNQAAIVNDLKASINAHTKQIPKSKRQMMFEELEAENEEACELRILSKEELQELDIHALGTQKAILEEQIKNVDPRLGIIDQYKEQEKLYEDRNKELEAVTANVEKYRTVLNDVSRRRLNEFAEALDIILSKLSLIYQMLTMGGTATLEWVDTHDPFSKGISYSVRPPEKSWKFITNLSGGEKTLSSLALVFALHFYRSTPFYIMDEIDAALDTRNVSLIAEYVKEQTRNAQFIIISLRPRMSIRSNYLMGVIKKKNVSSCHVISITTGKYITDKSKNGHQEDAPAATR